MISKRLFFCLRYISTIIYKNENTLKSSHDSNIFCDLFAGLGKKAQTGGDCVPFAFTGSCTGELNAHIHGTN